MAPLPDRVRLGDGNMILHPRCLARPDPNGSALRPRPLQSPPPATQHALLEASVLTVASALTGLVPFTVETQLDAALAPPSKAAKTP